MSAPRSFPDPGTAQRAAFGESALDAVLAETAALFHRMRVAAEEIHHQGELSSGRRSVLKGLSRLGPQSVPQMARSRPVSRQYIQALVNDLATDGLVEFIENPAHRRSPLVRLTPRGKDFVDEMDRRESVILSRLTIGIPEDELRAAADVLRRVRTALEAKPWRNATKASVRHRPK